MVATFDLAVVTPVACYKTHEQIKLMYKTKNNKFTLFRKETSKNPFCRVSVLAPPLSPGRKLLVRQCVHDAVTLEVLHAVDMNHH